MKVSPHVREVMLSACRRVEGRRLIETSSEDPGAAALLYAQQGWRALPIYELQDGHCACGQDACESPGKHPRTPHGVHDATTNPAVIREWWDRWRQANVGIATGEDLLVVDIDPRHGGDLSLEELRRRYGPLPETVGASSGGGGNHLYLSTDGTTPRGASTLDGLAGIDVKAAGGYIVAPPSVHISGRRYQWLPGQSLWERPLAPAPAWLLSLLPLPGEQAPAKAISPNRWRRLLQGVPKGERHTVATQIVGHYLGKGYPPEEVEILLVSYASQCRPPHDLDDIRRIVRDLTQKDHAREQAVCGLSFISLGAILREPQEDVQFLVHGHLPAGGLSILAGKPKTGKSTLARCLVLDVARGRSWLGFPTRRGPVFYLALEEKRDEVRNHFHAMGAAPDDPVRLLFRAPPDALPALRQASEQERPALIVIDPLFKLIRVRDGNDYVAVTQALEPLLGLARDTGAHVLAVHHLGKGERSGGDAILGSTAILASADTALFLKRSDRYRTLSSIQRYGTDLEEVVLTLDPDTRIVSGGLMRKEAEEERITQGIVEFLRGRKATEREILGAVEAPTAVKERVLRQLLQGMRVVRRGRGARGDPYVYSLPGADAPPPEFLSGSGGERENPNSDVTPRNPESNSPPHSPASPWGGEKGPSESLCTSTLPLSLCVSIRGEKRENQSWDSDATLPASPPEDSRLQSLLSQESQCPTAPGLWELGLQEDESLSTDQREDFRPTQVGPPDECPVFDPPDFSSPFPGLPERPAPLLPRRQRRRRR